jgi:hypothetical protein
MPKETAAAIEAATRAGKSVDIFRTTPPGGKPGPWQYKVWEKGTEPTVGGRPEDLYPPDVVRQKYPNGVP